MRIDQSYAGMRNEVMQPHPGPWERVLCGAQGTVGRESKKQVILALLGDQQEGMDG